MIIIPHQLYMIAQNSKKKIIKVIGGAASSRTLIAIFAEFGVNFKVSQNL